MIRLQCTWIVVVMALGGCSDDGTAGAGESSSGSGASTGADGSGGLTGQPTSPTGSATTSDPTDAATSSDSGGSVSTGDDATSSGSGTSGEQTSSSGSSSSGSGSSSSTGGPLEFMECYPDGGMDCPAGLTCYTSSCCFGVGFCVDPDAETCGGMLGDPCEDGGVCVLDLCIADGTGTCVPADLFDNDICTEQTKCWQDCVPD